MSRLAFLLSSLLALPLVASAQVIQGEDTIVYAPRTTLNLGGTDLTGTPQRPELDLITVPRRPVFKPLIVLRTHFTPELVASTRGL